MKHARIATIYIRSHSASVAAAKQEFLGLPEVVWVKVAHFLIKFEGACR
jgi:hypothetical protein